MKALLDFIVDILKVPSVLVGVIALIGLIAQKKSAADTIKGTIKTILGFIVLGGGATVLLGSLNPLGDIFQQAFNVQGVVPNNEAIVSTALEKYGTATALIMAFGMVANIAIARFTRLKFIFLTGHHTFYMACMIAVILVVAGFEGVQLVLVGALTLGLIMAFFPYIAQPFMRDITGSDEVGFGHFGTVGYVLAGLVGRSLRGKSRSTEEMNLPKNLSFLRDSSVSIALTMMVIYLVLVIAAGQDFVQQEKFSNGQNFLVWAVIQAITFAAGVFIILQGVRLILAEIVPAFTGFSQELRAERAPGAGLPHRLPLCAKRGAGRLSRQLRRWPHRPLYPRPTALGADSARRGAALLLRSNGGRLRQRRRRSPRREHRCLPPRYPHHLPPGVAAAGAGRPRLCQHHLLRR